MIVKKSNHAKLVDDSFEDFERLAATAADENDEEFIDDEDGEGDDDDIDSEDIDSEEGDEDGDIDVEEDGEDDIEDLDSDEDSDDVSEDDSDVDEDEYSDEVEGDSDEDDSDEDEYVDEADADEDDGDEEVVLEDGEDDSDVDEDEFVDEGDEDEYSDDESEGCDDAAANEEAVLAQLKAEGLCVIIGTAQQISTRELGMAIASLEDEEFGSEDADEDEDLEVDADEDELDSDEVDADEDSEEDIEVDADEDEDIDSEDDTDEGDVDSEDGEDGDEDEYSEDDAEGSDEGDEDLEVDADEDEMEDDMLDEDRLAPVATEEFLAGASVSDVELVMHADARNPVWNVIVAGVPAARIALSSFGEGANEVASFFRTEGYANGIKKAMASEGVLNLLKRSNADFYANSFKSSEIFAEASAAASSVADKKVTAALSGLREDFVDALKIVSAGMDKNFFSNKPNHLKRALFIGLAEAGVQNPAAVIEAAFQENGKHFEILAEMATELLDKPAEVRDTLRESIDEAGIIDRPAAAPAEIQASVNPGLALAKSFATASVATACATALSGSVAERKNSLRNLF